MLMVERSNATIKVMAYLTVVIVNLYASGNIRASTVCTFVASIAASKPLDAASIHCMELPLAKNPCHRL